MKTDNIEIEKKKRLKYLRQRLGLSQEEMAKVIGISRPNLSKIEGLDPSRNVPKNIYYLLHTKYQISEDWWEKGEGDPFENPNAFAPDLDAPDKRKENASNDTKEASIDTYDKDKYIKSLEGQVDSNKKVIALQEAEIERLKSEVKDLKDKVAGLEHELNQTKSSNQPTGT